MVEGVIEPVNHSVGVLRGRDPEGDLLRAIRITRRRGGLDTVMDTNSHCDWEPFRIAHELDMLVTVEHLVEVQGCYLL
eukprot:8163227-Heterocapsa_arctica.AAC.1